VARKRRVSPKPTPAAAVVETTVASGAIAAPLSGFFAISPAKALSILPDQPLVGWVTLSFTDQGDEYHLTDQLMFVPTDHFDAAIEQYQRAKQCRT
jgi:hypothetical protein